LEQIRPLRHLPAELLIRRSLVRIQPGALRLRDCTPCAIPCSLWTMAQANRRINVTLEPDYARKLASLAERTHVQEGTLARSLLSSALDEADPDASRITEILDGIPGAWERTQASIEQARRGETIPLSEL
jgi:hypothetical protein